MTDIEVPKWDPALESLVNEEFQKHGALTLDDFTRLSKEYTIRFDDIMFTVFELCLEGIWEYIDDAGRKVALTRDDVNQLLVNRRIKEEDMASYTGVWQKVI